MQRRRRFVGSARVGVRARIRGARGVRRSRAAGRHRARRRHRVARGRAVRRARRTSNGSTSAAVRTSKHERATRATPRSNGCGCASTPKRSSSRTPATTRPRPCCCRCCGAREPAGSPGMPARRGFIRRPLLGTRRRETHELCARLRLAPVHDPMNDDLHHRRVWLRREVIPRLEGGADRDLVEVLARQAEVLRDDDDLLESLAARHAPDDAAGDQRAAARAGATCGPALAGRARAAVDRHGRPCARGRAGRGPRRGAAGRRSGRTRPRAAGARRARPRSSPRPVGGSRLPGRARFGAVEIEAWIEHGAAGRLARRPRPGGVRRRSRPRGGGRPRRGAGRAVPPARSGRLEARARRARRGGRRREPAGRARRWSRRPEPVWVVGYRIDHRVRVTSGTRRFLWLSAEPATP